MPAIKPQRQSSHASAAILHPGNCRYLTAQARSSHQNRIYERIGLISHRVRQYQPRVPESNALRQDLQHGESTLVRQVDF